MRENPLLPNDKTATESDIKLFQGMVGSIMFAMIESRPDIAFATSLVSERGRPYPSRQSLLGIGTQRATQCVELNEGNEYDDIDDYSGSSMIAKSEGFVDRLMAC